MMNCNYSLCSDENILSLIREEGDELAFETLYNRYFKVLFNFAYSKVGDRFAAQEIVQELFVHLWQRKTTLAADNTKALLFSIIKRRIISHYRKELTRQQHYGEFGKQLSEATESADQPLLASELQNHYQESLQHLPPKCQEVFVLSRQGFANKQISEQLDISEKTVEQHITKALRLLKLHLREHIVSAFLYIFFF
jgi:RNA polymerase sigma-70 factor (family 1)